MNFRVAYRLRVVVSLLSVTALFVSIISAQTAGRKTGKRPTRNVHAAASSSDGTLIICQGVTVPNGYAIIAYLTSTACPHGAYVLKRQDPYSESVAARYAKGNQAAQSRDAEVAPTNASQTTSPAAPLSDATENVDPFANTSSPNGTVVQPPSQPIATAPVLPASNDASRSSEPGSRPRRVSVAASRDEVAITEDPPARPARPPRWTGTPPGPSSAAASDVAVVDPGPEEVGEGEVLRVNTSLVTVPVTVMDRQGRFIPDLQRGDFRVFENGVEQPVAYWEPADKPFTVALLLDTSPSTQFHLWQIKEAAIAFAKQLRPQDRVLIVSFNDQVLLLTEVTNDMQVVSAVVEQNANMGNATRLYDAVHLVIKERLNNIKGRKAIVVFTDGVDTASYQANYASTIREVEELDALIYPIQYDTTDYLRAMQGAGQGSTTVVTTTSNGPFGMGTTTSRVTYSGPKVTGPNGGPLPGATQEDYDKANQYLKELADKTAGRLYHANDTTQLADAFSRIAEELRRQYSLGYYPQSGDASSAARREIKVRVNRPNLAVKARESYVFTTPRAPQ